MKIFNSIKAAADALELKSNTLSKQLKKNNNCVEMYDTTIYGMAEHEQEVIVRRHKDGTVSVEIDSSNKGDDCNLTHNGYGANVSFSSNVPEHHVHTQKSDIRMSRMYGVEVEDEKLEPGIYVLASDMSDYFQFWKNTLAAKMAECTPSRISEIRRAAIVRQLGDNGSFRVDLKNGNVVLVVKANKIQQARKEKEYAEK